MEGHQQSCVFLIDHVAEWFQYVCNFKNFSNLSLISIVHSLLFYESHCTPLSYSYILFSEEERNKRQNKRPVFKYLSLLVSYFYSSFIDFLRITLQPPFIFSYFYIRGREKQETKQMPVFKCLSLYLISIVH